MKTIDTLKLLEDLEKLKWAEFLARGFQFGIQCEKSEIASSHKDLRKRLLAANLIIVGINIFCIKQRQEL